MDRFHGVVNRKAFTLIELLIVIGLIVAIIAVALPNLFGRRNTEDLANTATQIATLVRQAQSDAMAQEGGLSWGIHFQNGPGTPSYSLFSSSSSAYNASGTMGYYRLPSTVGYLASILPVGSSSTVIFSQITGTASASTSVGLYLLADSSQQSVVSIALSGSVSYGTNSLLPALTYMSPASAAIGGSSFTLTVYGVNFATSSVVDCNGSPRATTFISASSLSATILASDIASAGTASITVATPGVGTSNALSLPIALQIVQTTDTDFDAGTFSSSTVTGSGTGASVVLGIAPPVAYAAGAKSLGIAFDPLTDFVYLVNSPQNDGIDIVNVNTGAVFGCGAPAGATLDDIMFDSVTDSMWMTDHNNAMVYEMDASSTCSFKGNGSAVGSSPYDIAFDPVTDSVWVTAWNGGLIHKVNIYTGTSTAYTVGGGYTQYTEGIAFDPVTDSIWIGGIGSGSSTVFKVNINTGTSTTYTLGTYPTGIAFDPVTDSIWVTDLFSSTVFKVNINTGTSTAYAVGSEPEGIAFDPVTNSVWVANENSSTVSRVNIYTGASTAYTVGTYPVGVAFDPVTDSVWVTNYGSNTVSKVSIVDKYIPSGTFTSSAISVSATIHSYGTLSWAQSGGQTITMQARSAANSSMTGAAAWGSCGIANGGSFSSDPCINSGNSYIQYQAAFSTNNIIQSPSLDSVTITD